MEPHPVALYGFITTVVVVVCLTVLAALSKVDGGTAIAVIATLGGSGVGVAGGVTQANKHVK